MKTFDIDTEASVFNEVWPTGYTETFEGYVNTGCGKYGKKEIYNILSQYYDHEKTCLEIGCGGGMWTKECLIPNFKQVFCLDVIPQKFEGECTYIQVKNKDFFCTGIDNSSIDFLFSYGVFPHLSADAQATYLKNVFNKMKSGAKALLLFANFSRHPYYATASEEALAPYKNSNVSPTGATWFYMDLEITQKIIEDAGFTNFVDILPDFRDTLAYFEKP